MTDYMPTTELGKSMLHLRHMLALSARFQAKLGSGDQYDQAMSRIMYEGVPDRKLAAAEDTEELSDDLPFASIWPFATGFRTISQGVQNWMRPYGQLHIYLMTPRNDSMSDWNNRRIEAIDFLEGWTTDLASLSAAADTGDHGPIISGEEHMAIASIETPMHEHTPKEIQASAGDFYFRHMVVSFGEDSGGA